MRVLGVDPGLTRCGVGVVEGAGQRVALVHAGVVRTQPSEELSARLLTIHRSLEVLMDEHRPEVVAIERVFAQHNVRTVMGTAQAGAIAIVAAATRGIPVAVYTPSEMKAAVTGNGRAEKQQVGFMVTKVLGLAEMPKPADTADALALAITHLWRGAAKQRLADAMAANA